MPSNTKELSICIDNTTAAVFINKQGGPTISSFLWKRSNWFFPLHLLTDHKDVRSTNSGSYGKLEHYQGGNLLFPLHRRQSSGSGQQDNSMKIPSCICYPIAGYDTEGVVQSPRGSVITYCHITLFGPTYENEPGAILGTPPKAWPGVTGQSEVFQSLEPEAKSMEIDGTLLTYQSLFEVGMHQVQYGVIGQPYVLVSPYNTTETLQN